MPVVSQALEKHDILYPQCKIVNSYISIMEISVCFSWALDP